MLRLNMMGQSFQMSCVILTNLRLISLSKVDYVTSGVWHQALYLFHCQCVTIDVVTITVVNTPYTICQVSASRGSVMCVKQDGRIFILCRRVTNTGVPTYSYNHSHGRRFTLSAIVTLCAPLIVEITVCNMIQLSGCVHTWLIKWPEIHFQVEMFKYLSFLLSSGR